MRTTTLSRTNIPARAVLLGLATLLGLAASSSGEQQISLPKPPSGFQISLFASPPEVNYPVCLCAAPTGEVFVGIDKQGSLGKKSGQGRVVRCLDTDGDGQADQINTFAKMDHPRGLHYQRGKLWVLHPPKLTLYHDDDLDGVADRSETLVTGLTTELLNKRGADHTTNGIRMGIDGWLYIAVGDFGFLNAQGTDRTTLSLKGGGIARVRPDGTELEIYCRGLRNILDVCIDPRLNMFTRDNTNDGGGWDIRLSHIIQSGHYGYPSLFKNFSQEVLFPLADYGGGSGCGGVFASEPWLPSKYRQSLLTCDWGRSQVYFHPLTADGPTFQAGQEEFLAISRPTDIDVDGSGRLYISSWQGGKFNYSGENVGYVAALSPHQSEQGGQAPPVPNLADLSDEALLKQLRSPSHVRRLSAQREILQRGQKPLFADGLLSLAGNQDASLESRVAALFGYKQLYGTQANQQLVELTADPTLEEYALRALADRKTQLAGVPLKPFLQALSSSDPRVQLAAAIGLGRLGQPEAAEHLLRLAQSPEVKQSQAPRPRHQFRSKKIQRQQKAQVDLSIAGAKKLFLVVSDAGDGNGLDHVGWVEPRLVTSSGEMRLTELKWSQAEAGWGQVLVNRACDGKPLKVRGQTVSFGIGTHAPSVISYELPADVKKFQATGVLDDGANGRGSVGFSVYTDHLPQAVGKKTQTSDPNRVIPHVAVRALAELKAVSACLQSLEGPSRSGALAALKLMHEPTVVDGLLARLDQQPEPQFRKQLLQVLVRLYYREGPFRGDWWGTRPDTTGPYYHRQEWEKTAQIRQGLIEHLKRADRATFEAIAAELQRHRVQIPNLPSSPREARPSTATIKVVIPKFDQNNPHLLGNLAYQQIVARTSAHRGRAQTGEKLFRQQSCLACHALTKDGTALGPQLADIGKRYDRKKLIESIVKPSAQLAQGFGTGVFLMDNGKVYTGFVVREAAEEVEIRTAKGQSKVLLKSEIEERGTSKQSVMPEGLVSNLTPEQFADLLAYLESLSSQ